MLSGADVAIHFAKLITSFACAPQYRGASNEPCARAWIDALDAVQDALHAEVRRASESTQLELATKAVHAVTYAHERKFTEARYRADEGRELFSPLPVLPPAAAGDEEERRKGDEEDEAARTESKAGLSEDQSSGPKPIALGPTLAAISMTPEKTEAGDTSRGREDEHLAKDFQRAQHAPLPAYSTVGAPCDEPSDTDNEECDGKRQTPPTRPAQQASAPAAGEKAERQDEQHLADELQEAMKLTARALPLDPDSDDPETPKPPPERTKHKEDKRAMDTAPALAANNVP